MQVHYDEGVAIRIGPKPCAGVCEGVGEASAGVRAGQPLSRERTLPDADAVVVAEGETDERVSASARPVRRGLRTWHARMFLVREPGDLLAGLRPLGANGPRREGEEP